MRNLRLAGPSANPLMTADEYERNRRTESNALRASVERHYPAWTDAHIPRTEKPVRFIPYLGFVYPIERLSLHRA